MAFRYPSILVLSAVLLFSTAVPARAADTQTAALVSVSRGQVVVDAGTVTLGDLFTNTGEKAHRIIDQAPAPGTQSQFDVYRLAAIARAHGLTWQAQSWSERVVVERASQTIPAEQVLGALRSALESQAAPGERFEIDLGGRDMTLTLARGTDNGIGVENLRFSPISGQFSATIVAPAGDPAATRTNVAGRVHRVVDVPMLNKRVASGDVIGRDDINWVSMRANLVSRNMITDADRLIGMTPIRTAVAGKPINNGDVRAPRLVLKGSMVTMVLRTPHMVLTSKGKAIQHGAKGETIRVMNTQSKTVVEGEVAATGMVTVTANSFLPLGVARNAAPNARN